MPDDKVTPIRTTRAEQIMGPGAVAPIQSVVTQHLCHGCGSCVSACPVNALEMEETSSGFLIPALTGDCTSCGACGDACPGAQLATGLLHEDVDPFKGRVLGAYLARAADRRYWKNGQSGGAVTALIDHMLRAGRCDGALVTSRVDAAKRPRPFVALTADDLLSAQGSKYCPVALNAAIRTESFQRLERPAVVGLSCHLHGIRMLELLEGTPLARKPVLLGLICTGTWSFHMIDHLRQAARPACLDEDFEGLRYKDKASYGWPGDISVYSKAHGQIRVPERHRHRAKPAFRHPRCSLCFDQMNVLSDISFGDPWGLRKDAGGWTVVLTRTEIGQRVLDEAVAAKALTAERVEPEAVFAGQTIDSRHRPDWALSTSLWREMGFVTPDFGIDASWYSQPDRRRRSSHRRLLSYGLAFLEEPDRARAIRMAKGRIRRAKVGRAIAFPAKAVRGVLRRLGIRRPGARAVRSAHQGDGAANR